MYLGHRTKDSGHQTEDLNHRTEDLNHRTKDLNNQTEDLGQQTSDLNHQTKDLNLRTKNLNHRREDLSRQTLYLDILMTISIESRFYHIKNSILLLKGIFGEIYLLWKRKLSLEITPFLMEIW